VKALIIGGTQFVGRTIVESAAESGDEIVLMNRGRSGADLFPGLPRVTGDRMEPATWDEAARHGPFDVVIDCCGYFPRQTDLAADRARDLAARYVFVSTVSVYAGEPASGLDEESDLVALADPTTEEVNGATYGGLKVLCERSVVARFSEALIVRPGLIVGPYDHTDRFTYWAWRLATDEPVLAPDSDDPVQFIDVRDLAQWTLNAARRGLAGTFNLVGPAEPIGFREFLLGTRAALGSQSPVRWASGEWLAAHEVAPWSDLPVWLGSSEALGLARVSCSRAMAEGLTHRPLAETVLDLMAWRETGGPLRAGLSDERHAALLAELG
jgi:2'-hydroxyisoflavone reductase